jgi:L-lactate dehydrogenase complex protein LldF
MSRRIDHAEASSRFIAAKDHIEFHDKRLWDLRLKRDREAEAMPEWEELRSLASAIKEHALSHLADYLLEFERNAVNNGAQVHWASTSEQARQIILSIVREKKARSIIKSKVMTGEEIHLNEALEKAGLTVVESDFGEYIVQLRQEAPYHFVFPAMHLVRGEISELFQKKLGSKPTNDPEELMIIARQVLRDRKTGHG